MIAKRKKVEMPKRREKEASTIAETEDVPDSPNIGTTSPANEMEKKHPKSIPHNNIKGKPKPSDPRQNKGMKNTGQKGKQQQKDGEGSTLTDLGEINGRRGQRGQTTPTATDLMILPKFATEYRHKTTAEGEGEEEREKMEEEEDNNNSSSIRGQQQHTQQQQGERVANPPADVDLRTAPTPQEQQQLPQLMTLHLPPSPYNNAELGWKNKCLQKEGELNSTKKQLEAKSKECNSLVGSVNELQKQLKAMGTTTMPRDLNELKNEKRELIKKKNDLEQKNKEKDETITKMKKKTEGDERKMAEMIGQNKKKEEERRKEIGEYRKKIEEMTKQKDKLEQEQRTENDQLKTELRKKEETIEEQKKQLEKEQQKRDKLKREALIEQKQQLVDEHRTEMDNLKAEMRKKEAEGKEQLMEEHRGKNDKLRTELLKNKEEALSILREQLEEEKKRNMVELETKLNKEYAKKIEHLEKQVSSQHKEVERRTQTAEIGQMNDPSFNEQRECEATHCGDNCAMYRKMVEVYKNVMEKHAKDGKCSLFEPLLFGPEIMRRAKHWDIELRPSSDAVLPTTNATTLSPTPDNLNGLLTDGQHTTNHGAEENEIRMDREAEDLSADQLLCVNDGQEEEERPPSLERSESVANSLPSVNFNQSSPDHFEQLKQQTREKIAQEMRLNPNDPAVEILVQKAMAIYNKRTTTTMRQVLVEEFAQQQSLLTTPPPQLNQQIAGGNASTLSNATQNRHRETEELMQRFESAAGSVHSQRQKLFHSPNMFQNALTINPNSTTTTEKQPKQKKRKLAKSLSGDQQPIGLVEHKHPRQQTQPQTVNVQQQTLSSSLHPNVLIQPNHPQSFVGFPQSANNHLFQAVQQHQQMDQQRMFPVGLGNQSVQQQICGSSTATANCWGTNLIYAQQQTMSNFVPPIQLLPYPAPPVSSHNQQSFQHQQPQQFVQPQQFHQQSSIIHPVAFEPSHQIQHNSSLQQSDSQHGATEFDPSDISSCAVPSSTTTTTNPIAQKIIYDFFEFFNNFSGNRNADGIVLAFLTSKRDTMTNDQKRGVFPQLSKLADEMIRGIKQNVE